MQMAEFQSSSLSIGTSPIEMFKYRGKRETEEALRNLGFTGNTDAQAGGGSNIEANLWLPFAAKEYNLSTDIRDYVLVPVPILFSDIPNTNGDSVSMAQLLRFYPDLGMQAFKTFRGKPTFVEHDNQDITRAKGVIMDVFLRRLRRFGNGRYFKLVELLAWDRTKDPLLVNSILSGENNAYSLGFYFQSYECSICRLRFGKGARKEPCNHTRVSPKPMPTHQMPDGRLAYRMCETIMGFETSSVVNPAYCPAISHHVFDLSKAGK